MTTPSTPPGHGEIADPFGRAFPNADRPGYMRILGQTAVGFGIGHVVQNVDDAGAADAGRIVDAGIRESSNARAVA